MDKRLAGCRQRLIRADQHLTFLDKRVRVLLDGVDRRLVGHFDRKASEYVFCARGKIPPPTWGIRTGEFAHHMRAALDELIWQLVLRRGGTPRTGAGGTTFPILDNESKWKARRTWDALQGISRDDRTAIKETQPFNWGPELQSFHPLAQLEELNNADKHRFLQPALVAPQAAQPVGPEGLLFHWERIRDIGEIQPTDIRFVSRRTSHNRTEILRIHLRSPGPDPQMEMKNEIALTVSLKDGNPFFGIETLREIRVFVEQQVLKRLAPAFDG